MRMSAGLRNACYDIHDFLCTHRLKLIMFAAVFVIACAVGVRTGMGAEVETVIENRLVYRLLFGAENRNVILYALFMFLYYLLCIAIAFVLGLNFYTSFLSSLLFFYTAYSMGYGVSVIFIAFGVGSLPFIIIAYIPHCFTAALSMCCAVIVTVDLAAKNRRCGGFSRITFCEYLPHYTVCMIASCAATVYIGVVGGIFSAGLIM